MSNTKTKRASFSAGSSNLWVNVINLILSGIAIAGVALPQTPAEITAELSTTLSSTGWIAVIGLIIVNIGSPLYHALVKGPFNLKAILGSSNFWVQAFSLLSAFVASFGIIFPAGTGDQLVGAIYAKDWFSLGFVLVTNIMNPLIRYFRDRSGG